MKIDQYFWLYVLECEDGSLYTGYTKNLAIRYYQHRQGKQSARYTRSFKPIRIAQCWTLFDSVGTALKVERFIKNQNRGTKLLWIENPERLKLRISKYVGREILIFPFDTSLVEQESVKMDWRKVKNNFDPFSKISIASI